MQSNAIFPLFFLLLITYHFQKEIDIVKYDLNFAKNSYQNRFDQELQNKSIEM